MRSSNGKFSLWVCCASTELSCNADDHVNRNVMGSRLLPIVISDHRVQRIHSLRTQRVRSIGREECERLLSPMAIRLRGPSDWT
jgi:hypothetical protein